MVVEELLKLTGEFIRFPETTAEVASAKADFMAKLQMPDIVCAIDGAHVAIVKPTTDAHLYCNSNAHYSLHVLAACDANQLFVFGDANYPGSVHESEIWQMTAVDEWMSADAFMLGDSAFPSNKCILTPSPNAEPGSRAEKYNVAHKRARDVARRTFGALQRRFRCLHSKHRALHYAPKKAGTIVYACMVLHNICMLRKMPLPVGDDDDETEDNPDGVAAEYVVLDMDEVNKGLQVRDAYIERYF